MDFKVTSCDSVMLIPTTVQEAGMLSWICTRLGHSPVTLRFDTTHIEGCTVHPAAWLETYAPKKQSE